ncbi:bifunctional 5,10-methylenetetrahydrofolate dehydrogenase/5,10-methenyltetrahydrofolate cyclohydrolase [Candidatus Giovannonibacteria bacterium]|nr:bifunctional 5,10-methylenetetrahydrofolate dehydrogenase/5,10-methenyltetrahydrofolate cyclohydrolase [Candidatus Giovannonibacteria bacterium]
MIVDGKAIAEKIRASLREEIFKLNKSGKKIRLAVIKVSGDPVTEKYLKTKKNFAESIGVEVRVYEVLPDISTNKLREKVSEIVHIKENNGVIIQLPFPEKINIQYVLDAIIPEKDPDMLSSRSLGKFGTGKSRIFPPVVAAVNKIFKEYGVELKGKQVVVVGAGRLVGKPITTWLLNQKATISVIDENTPDVSNITLRADVIISGVGKPGLIKPDMVKEGAVLIDCGTSESSGQVRGDIDPEAAKKASLFAPVPGGVGPVTVAMLFKNLLELSI